METEDAVTSTNPVLETALDTDEPQNTSPLPANPADSGPVREESPQPTAPAADVQLQLSDQSLLVHETPSGAVRSAEIEQSVQADVSEILVPSSSVALIHSQHSESGTEAPLAGVQLFQPANPTTQAEQLAEGEAVETAQVSSSAAPVITNVDSTVAEQLLPDKDAPAASGQQEGDTIPIAHATFVVPTENWKHLQMVPLATTAAEIKHSLCSNWNIAESALSVKYHKQELQDAQSLASCGIQDGEHVDIELVIHYQMLSTPHPKQKSVPAKTAKLPSKFEVHVLEGPAAEVKTVTVLIDVTQKQPKAYSGGYKDKRNGTLYHNADCQTDNQLVAGPRAQRAERQCQTVEVKQRSAQTCREAHVQMARPDLLLNTAQDKILAARPYVSASEVWAVKEKSAATIQRFTRGWLARKRVSFMLREARQGSAAASRAAAQTAEHEAAYKRREAERRLQPRSPADFALLHSELEAWRLAETARIKSAGLSPEDCHQALAHLLHQGTKLLQSIDRMQGEADVVRREQKVAQALSQMAHPKSWPLSNGGLLQVHTPATTKAGELRGLYRGLQLQGLPAAERLDVLLHVKFCAKEFACSLTPELLQLINREADLINRGRKPSSMEGLRKRISTLFLQLIENPMFNPEAANFFNLGAKTCSTESYMFTGLTASDSAMLAAKSLLV
ncbi:Protein phosphatase 1G [Trebouxia sp. C0009 RCD-2024]